MLACEGVSLRYGDVLALDGVSLDAAPGEILCLLGPSGSGKSSLLRVIAGLERPERGRVYVAGSEVAGQGVFVEPELRRVGMVSQDYALFPHLTVAENVAFGIRRRDRGETRRTVAALLERVGLAHREGSYPHMLSGGERQRVALVRALAAVPRVLVMDEPFSSLDSRLRDQVRKDTIALLRETATTTVVVTHDPQEAMRIADRIALLRGGRVLQCGSVEEVYSRPTTAFAARLFSELTELEGTCLGALVETPLGRAPAPHLPEGAGVRVLIRPQHVRVAQAPAGVPGTVLSSEFLGDVERLLVGVEALAAPVSLNVPSPSRIAPGDVIRLELDPRGTIVVPADPTD
jgi:iron(III) transport system ATP-binding protein